MTDGKIVQSEERTITLCRPNVVNGKDIFKNHMGVVMLWKMIRTQTRKSCGHTPGARVHISGKSRGTSSLECKPAHSLITHLVKIEKAAAFSRQPPSRDTTRA
jgi:hypothetical protein